MTAHSNAWLKAAGLTLAGALVVRGILRRRRRIELVGAKVLVTGGSRGLGFAAAR